MAMLFLLGNISGAAMASGGRYYTIADDISSSGWYEVEAIVENIENMGFTVATIDLPTPNTIYSGLVNAEVAVIHGHGGAGYSVCRQSNGNDLYLYANNSSGVSLSNLASGSLDNLKLMIFISCYSATGSTGTRSNSMVRIAYNKGAQFVIGFINAVAAGEWYINYFTDYVREGYSYASALSNADYSFTIDFGSPTTIYPHNTSNRYTLGSTNSTIYD